MTAKYVTMSQQKMSISQQLFHKVESSIVLFWKIKFTKHKIAICSQKHTDMPHITHLKYYILFEPIESLQNSVSFN